MSPSRKQSDERVPPTKSDASGHSGGTYLRDRPLEDRLDDGERIENQLSNKKKGVELVDEGTRYRPGNGCRAFAAATDRRLLFVVGGAADGRDAEFGVPYTEIEHVTTSGSVFTKRLEVRTIDGGFWRFSVRRGADLGAAADYVDRAAVAWSRVEAKLREARKHVVAVDDHLVAGEYDAAEDAVARAERSLEAAREAAGSLAIDRTEPVRERVAEVERRIERMRARGHMSRAKHLTHKAERRWRGERYEEAYRRYADARTQLERALGIAEAHEFEEVTEILERLDRVIDTIESLAAAPLERAETARDRAREAPDPEASVALLEEALERYRTALELDWGADERRFDGDSDAIRSEVEAVVRELTETRRGLAARHRRAGEIFESDGRCERAIAAHEAAVGHLGGAIEVADEFAPDAADRLRTEREALEARIADLRRQAAEEVFEFVGDRDDGSAPTIDSLVADDLGLLELDDAGFERVVARFLRERGWETTRLGGDREFDLWAEDGDESLLVLTRRCPRGVAHGADAVAVLADRRDALEEADAAAAVTTGTFTDDARALADRRDVTLLDLPDFRERLRDVGLTDVSDHARAGTERE